MANYIKKSPCQDCEDRELGCHSACSKYLGYREMNKEFYKKRMNAADISCYMHDEVCKNIYKHGRTKHGF